MNKARIKIGDLVKIRSDAPYECLYFSKEGNINLSSFVYRINDLPILYFKKEKASANKIARHYFLYKEKIIIIRTYDSIEKLDNWFEKVVI